MKCCDILAVMSDYLDQDLDQEKVRKIEAHFKDCRRCLYFFQTFRKTILLSRSWGQTVFPSEVRQHFHYFLSIERTTYIIRKSSGGSSSGAPRALPKPRSRKRK